MPRKKKTALSRKRMTLAKKKTTKGITRKPRSIARARGASPSKRKTASANKKATPRASTKRATKNKVRRQSPASKAKSSTTKVAHPKRMQPSRRKARPETGPRNASLAKRDTIEVVEQLVVDTVEEVAPGILVVKEYEIEGEAVVTPAQGRSKAF